MKRREFMKVVGMSSLAIPFLGSAVFNSSTALAAADLPLPEEGKGTAGSLKYCADADKAAKAKKPACPDRAKPDRKDQYCHNCQLFKAARGEGKAAVGKCIVLPKNFVAGNAWCNSWVKKPG